MAGSSYERFYDRAFAEMKLDQKIVKKGGGESLAQFKEASKNVLENNSKKDYWDVMFNRQFTITKGKSKGEKRKSKFGENLGKAIFKEYFEGKERDYIVRESVSQKTGRLRKSFIVRKGKSIQYGGKTYRGGKFIPFKFAEENEKD